MTAAPKTSIRAEAVQKKKGDIGRRIRFPGSGFKENGAAVVPSET
jgi:hypothetical protein